MVLRNVSSVPGLSVNIIHETVWLWTSGTLHFKCTMFLWKFWNH